MACAKCGLDKPAEDFIAKGRRHSAFCRACRERQNTAMKKSLDSNPSARAGLYAQNRLNKAIRTGRASAALVALIGCTLPFFLSHLESLWAPGMSYGNYGRGPGTWQLDHIVPRSSWEDLGDETQAKAAFHWSNLHPLCATQNMKKGCRLKSQ